MTSHLRAGFFATVLLLTTAISVPAFAAESQALPDLSPSDIAQDVKREFNNRTGTSEFIAPTFDPFEEDRSMAGSVSLRSVGAPVTSIDGDVLSDGAILDLAFYYNSQSDDPFDTLGFTDAAFLSGSLAPAVRRDNRILECSRNVQDVVYDHTYYYAPTFRFRFHRPYRYYSGHHRYGRFDRPFWRNRGYRGYNRGWGRTSYPRGYRNNDRRDDRQGDRARNNNDRNDRGRVRRDRDRDRADNRDRDRNNDRTRDRRREDRADNRGRAIRMDRDGRMRGTVNQGRIRAENAEAGRNRDNNARRSETRRNDARRAETRRNNEARRTETRRVREGNRTRETRRNETVRNNERRDTRRRDTERREVRTPQRREVAPRNMDARARNVAPRANPPARAARPAPRPRVQTPPPRRSETRPAPRPRANPPKKSSTGKARQGYVKSRGSSRSIKRQLNFFPKRASYSREVVRNVDVDCAREEMLSVFIPAERLEAARYDGLTVLALDNGGREYPVFIPPNYIEGFKQAVGGRFAPSSGVSVPTPYSGQPVYRETQPVYQPPARERIEAPCPAGTTKQPNGTCLQTSAGYPR